MNTIAALSPESEAALTHVGSILAEKAPEQSEPLTLSQRIINAFAVAQASAAQMSDLEKRKKADASLLYPGVSGSLILGVNGVTDVVSLLSSVRNWKEVAANLGDEQIIVFEGELPRGMYKAFAAYASMDEIACVYGREGINNIQVKLGHHQKNEVYFSTMMRMPTNILTVQLEKIGAGVEKLRQWFPGKEIASRLFNNAGDNLVRMNVHPKAKAETPQYRAQGPRN